MILVDLQNQMFTPLYPESKAHLYSHLVFAANGSAVNTTIIDGKIVYARPRVHDDRRAEGAARGERRVPRVLERMVVPT